MLNLSETLIKCTWGHKEKAFIHWLPLVAPWTQSPLDFHIEHAGVWNRFPHCSITGNPQVENEQYRVWAFHEMPSKSTFKKLMEASIEPVATA